MTVSNLSKRFLEINGVLPKPTAPANKPGYPGVQTTAKTTPPVTPVLMAAAQQVGPPNSNTPTIDRKPETVAEAQERLDKLVEGGGSIRAIENASEKLREAQQRLDSQVEFSADRIENLLDSDGAFQWVARGEIIDAAEEMTQHDRETTNAIFDEIESRGLLDDFIKETYDAGHVGGGIPGDQRRAFFDQFGEKLYSSNLVALTEELKEVSRVGGKDTVGELAESIAEHAPDRTRLAYVKKLADETTVYDPRDDHYPSFVDVEGAAIARVISGMEDTENIERALAHLDDDQLTSVINAGNDRTIIGPGIFDNSELYADFASAVGRIDTSTGTRGVDQVGRFVHFSAERLRQDGPTQRNNPVFKDALGDVFADHLENLVGDSLTESGAITLKFGQDVETISQYVLFSNPPGENQETQAEDVAGVISGWINEAQTGVPSDRTRVGATSISHENLANVAGQLLHHNIDGLEAAVASGEADKAARDAAARFLVNIAFDVMPSFDTAEKVVNSVFSQTRGEFKNQIIGNIIADDIGVNSHGFEDFYALLRENIGSPTSTHVDDDLATIRIAFEDGLDGPS